MKNSPLQKYPKGLLELLRLRTEGFQPGEFGSAVIPGVVANEHYGADLQFTSQDLSGPVPFPYAGNFVIGAGAAAPGPIRLMNVSCEIVIGAAAGTRLLARIGIQTPASSSPTTWVAAQQFTPSIEQTFAFLTNFPVPFVLMPGTGIALRVDGDAAGNDHSVNFRSLQQVLNTG